MEEMIRPFLRWAGGKGWLANTIMDFVPQDFSNYFEPFLGGGAIFINLKAKGIIKNRAYLSDINSDLVNAYRQVKSNPRGLFNELSNYQNSEEFYYKIRATMPKCVLKNAARFIYLNKTSFNGIYRVNKEGHYNVPYGHKSYREIFDENNLESLSICFKNTFFACRDFEKTLQFVKKGDLVFLDPPYTVAHESNGFVKYNQRIFSWDDQIRLSQYIQELVRRKVYFILTNASHQSIFDLYKKYASIWIVSRQSVVGGKHAARQRYRELIITNV